MILRYSLIFTLFFIVACGSNTKKASHQEQTGTAPSVDAGTPIKVTNLPRVYFNATVSDKENDIISYQWHQISGPEPVTLVNADTLSAYFDSPKTAGTYQFELTVRDKTNLRAKDTVSVEVDHMLGVWIDAGTGDYYAFFEDNVNNYQVTLATNTSLTSGTCILSETYARHTIADNYSLILSDDFNQLQIGGRWHMRSPEALPHQCQSTQLIPVIGQTNYKFDAVEHLDIVWNNLNEFHPLFHLKGINQTRWDKVYAAARTSLSHDSSENALWNTLIEMLSNFEQTTVNQKLVKGDGHISLLKIPPHTEEEQEYAAGDPDVFSQQIMQECKDMQLSASQCERYLEQELDAYLHIITNYLDQDSLTVYQGSEDESLMIFGQIKDHSTGYMLLQTMSDMVPTTLSTRYDYLSATALLMEEFLTTLGESDIEKLIIDLRMNGGGYDDVANTIASYFLSTETEVAQIQVREYQDSIDNMLLSTPISLVLQPATAINFTGEVIILTSRSTGSAAETLTNYLLANSTTRVIGERSRGNLSSETWKQLPNGWLFSFSNEVVKFPVIAGAYQTEPTLYEGLGTPVYMKVPFFSQTDRQENIDSGIEAAVSLFNK